MVKILAFLVALLLTPHATAQDDRRGIREFTESGIWQVPDGVTEITVELWGAGGGGAGGGSAAIGGGPGGGGAGGGSGAYVRARMAVKPRETYNIRIGAGGAGGRGESRQAAEPGRDGEDTALVRDGKTLIVVKGGSGGGAPRYGDIRGGTGGAGGTAEPHPARITRAGNVGGRGHDGGFSEWNSTSGGVGGAAVTGTVQPSGSFGGAGGRGQHFGYSEDGKPGGAGVIVVSW